MKATPDRINLSVYVSKPLHRAVRIRMTELGLSWEGVIRQSLSEWLVSTEHDGELLADRMTRLEKLFAGLS